MGTSVVRREVWDKRSCVQYFRVYRPVALWCYNFFGFVYLTVKQILNFSLSIHSLFKITNKSLTLVCLIYASIYVQLFDDNKIVQTFTNYW